PPFVLTFDPDRAENGFDRAVEPNAYQTRRVHGVADARLRVIGKRVSPHRDRQGHEHQDQQRPRNGRGHRHQEQQRPRDGRAPPPTLATQPRTWTFGGRFPGSRAGTRSPWRNATGPFYWICGSGPRRYDLSARRVITHVRPSAAGSAPVHP